MNDRICLFCGKPLTNNIDDSCWHKACIKSFFGEDDIPFRDINDTVIDALTLTNIKEGNVTTGVQKKLSVETQSRRKKKVISSNKYILKINEEKYPRLNELEWIGNRLADICGFKVIESGLIRLNNNEGYLYITKRIDRELVDEKIKKIPMEDFCQLSELLTYDKYSGSYEKAYKRVIEKYSNFKFIDRTEYFRMVFFSYIIGNTDMHLKNFSLYKKDGLYRLTPFYDIVPVLIVINQYEMALTINGKNKNITKNDFIKFGLNIGMQEQLIKVCIETIINKKEKMFNFIKSSTLDEELKNKFILFISKRLEQFI